MVALASAAAAAAAARAWHDGSSSVAAPIKLHAALLPDRRLKTPTGRQKVNNIAAFTQVTRPRFTIGAGTQAVTECSAAT
jgi:hypothetical protein